jgi:hypothetical protein
MARRRPRNGRITVGRSKTQAGLHEITVVPILCDVLAAKGGLPLSRRRARLRRPRPPEKDNLGEPMVSPVFERADNFSPRG